MLGVCGLMAVALLLSAGCGEPKKATIAATGATSAGIETALADKSRHVAATRASLAKIKESNAEIRKTIPTITKALPPDSEVARPLWPATTAIFTEIDRADTGLSNAEAEDRHIADGAKGIAELERRNRELESAQAQMLADAQAGTVRDMRIVVFFGMLACVGSWFVGRFMGKDLGVAVLITGLFAVGFGLGVIFYGPVVGKYSAIAIGVVGVGALATMVVGAIRGRKDEPTSGQCLAFVGALREELPGAKLDEAVADTPAAQDFLALCRELERRKPPARETK